MNFEYSAKVQQMRERLLAFMQEHIYPNEQAFHHEVDENRRRGNAWIPTSVVESLKPVARDAGLWNLFLPRSSRVPEGLSNLEYAPLCEIMGRVHFAPEVFNCSAPDTGNMETLERYASEAIKREWLDPLLRGEIRSAFAMTEPDVASSDARNIRTSIKKDGDRYIINGTKWWTTGAMDERCKILIVMGKTNPDADDHHQQSMILVPIDTPGVVVKRNLTVLGYVDQHGHAEVSFTNVKVPAANLIGKEGEGFALAQARLGPGRIHHCMRAIGMAERALQLMIKRSLTRTPFGKELARQGVVQEWIAEARVDIEQARLLVLKAAWIIDNQGAKAARKEIAAIKVAVPRMAERIINNAIQAHGGAGVSQDTPLAAMYAGVRTLRIVDGPDEVHLRDIARLELKPYIS